MATPLTISIPHELGRAEARRRIEDGFAKAVQQLPGSGATTERWDGDRMTFGIAAMGQSLNGGIDVQDSVVTIEVELPGILGLVAGSLKGHLQKAGQLLLQKK